MCTVFSLYHPQTWSYPWCAVIMNQYLSTVNSKFQILHTLNSWWSFDVFLQANICGQWISKQCERLQLLGKQLNHPCFGSAQTFESKWSYRRVSEFIYWHWMAMQPILVCINPCWNQFAHEMLWENLIAHHIDNIDIQILQRSTPKIIQN